jgi:DNA polymerase I-like protein with 3'-5' exonuclease and polymerase domains
MLTIKNPNTFDWANMSLHDCCEGNAYDVYFTLKLYHLLVEKLDDLGMMPLVNKMISPALSLFADMEYKGIDVSREELDVVGRELRSTNIEVEDDLYEHSAVQTYDNLSSTKDLIEVLYTREGALELYPPTRTKTGSPSTDAPTLKTLLSQIEEELVKRGSKK